MDPLDVDELAVILRRERHLLRLLLFKFVEVQLLLGGGEVRFVPWAAREADRARQQTREIDLLRATAVQQLGLRGLRGGTPSLREVAAVAAEPSAGRLRDHHEALCALVAEIELIGHACADAARTGIGDVARSVPSIGPRAAAVSGAGPPGDGQPSRAFALDAVEDQGLELLETEAAYQAVLEGTGRLRIPSLLAFLR